jgi:hypothetical protein
MKHIVICRSATAFGGLFTTLFAGGRFGGIGTAAVRTKCERGSTQQCHPKTGYPLHNCEI